jgi:hypothetical protein
MALGSLNRPALQPEDAHGGEQDPMQTLMQKLNGESSVNREIREQATLAMIQLARPNAELLATLVRNMQTQTETETSSFEATGMPDSRRPGRTKCGQGERWLECPRVSARRCESEIVG